jgi:hypothetical protein
MVMSFIKQFFFLAPISRASFYFLFFLSLKTCAMDQALAVRDASADDHASLAALTAGAHAPTNLAQPSLIQPIQPAGLAHALTTPAAGESGRPASPSLDAQEPEEQQPLGASQAGAADAPHGGHEGLSTQDARAQAPRPYIPPLDLTKLLEGETAALEADTERTLHDLSLEFHTYSRQTQFYNGAFAGSMAVAAAWASRVAKSAMPKKPHRGRLIDGGGSARETVNIVLDVVTRLLPPVLLVGGGWWGWRKIKHSIGATYESHFQEKVQKLSKALEQHKRKMATDLAEFESNMREQITTQEKKQARAQEERDTELSKRLAQQDEEIRQARLNTVDAVQSVLRLQDDFAKRTQDLIKRLEAKDHSRADQLYAEQQHLIESVATYCRGISQHIADLGDKVEDMEKSNRELKDKVALTVPQFKRLFEQLAAIKTTIEREPTGASRSWFLGGRGRRGSVPTLPPSGSSGSLFSLQESPPESRPDTGASATGHASGRQTPQNPSMGSDPLLGLPPAAGLRLGRRKSCPPSATAAVLSVVPESSP